MFFLAVRMVADVTETRNVIPSLEFKTCTVLGLFEYAIGFGILILLSLNLITIFYEKIFSSWAVQLLRYFDLQKFFRVLISLLNYVKLKLT